ncbi:MAG: hypothetical protein HQL42_04530 [Alphaproteobacteria bacterium]|nr:hypothetical protein [Alphaproteobacteria bacterium]
MQFNFYLKNHHVTGLASLEDIIGPISAGLVEGGHQVQFEYTQLLPRPWVNVMFEYFPDTGLIDELAAARAESGSDLILGLIGTEDLSDTISMGDKGDQRRLDNMRRVMGGFDFIWSIVPVDDYARLFPDCRPAYFLPFGHCPSLEQEPVLHQGIDVMLYGKLNGWRAPVVQTLLEAGARVQATFGDMPEFIRRNMLGRSKMVLDMRRGDVVRYMSPSRICAALQCRTLVVAETFDVSLLSSLYRYVVPADYGDLAATCLALMADDSARRARTDELFARFKAETSMRANLEALLPTIPA